ncbi:hypothetical protein D3C78_773510 [compost metagenome]
MTSKTPTDNPAAKPAEPTKPKRGPGRPTTYSAEMAERICAALMEPCSLNRLCKRPGMPARAVVCRWLIRHEEFRLAYQAAMAVRIDLVVDETLDIADDAEPDPAAISKAKLMIDSRWRMAERLAARKYGIKQQVETSVTQLTHEQWLEHLA